MLAYTPIDNLPVELFEAVTCFLPSYAFVGKKSIHTVSKQWNDRLNSGTQSFFRRHLCNILSSCETDEDVINILTDENLVKQFSVNQFLCVFSCHRALTLQMLRSGIIFPPEHLELMVINQDWFSQYFLETQIPTEDNVLLLSEALDVIACSNLTVAEYFLSKLELGKTLGFDQKNPPTHLTSLKYAYEIMDRIALDERQFLIRMGSAHVSIALRILNNDSIFKTLTSDELCVLGRAHFEVTQFYIQKLEILDRLQPNSLAQLAVEHIEFADFILKNNALLEKMGSKAILNICLAHKQIAMQFFKDIELKDKWFSDPIAYSKFLIELGQTYCSIAEQILADPQMYKLANCTPFSFSGHLPIRRRILADYELMKKLWEELESTEAKDHSQDIYALYTADMSLFEKMVTHPTLSKKFAELPSKHSKSLALMHARVAELMVDCTQSNISDSIISDEYIFLSQRLSLRTSRKVSEEKYFSQEELNKMKLNASIFAKVQEFALAYQPLPGKK